MYYNHRTSKDKCNLNLRHADFHRSNLITFHYHIPEYHDKSVHEKQI